VDSGSSRLREHVGGHGLSNQSLTRENRREKYFGGPAVFLQITATPAAYCFESGNKLDQLFELYKFLALEFVFDQC
jgi:hypothetical protein